MDFLMNIIWTYLMFIRKSSYKDTMCCACSLMWYPVYLHFGVRHLRPIWLVSWSRFKGWSWSKKVFKHHALKCEQTGFVYLIWTFICSFKHVYCHYHESQWVYLNTVFLFNWSGCIIFLWIKLLTSLKGILADFM